ncbi:MAG: LPXTG cell wall anchor domain-containing protein [Firmicutes bacterium]|nr:LPXTG cell wall anchor domain-containing protein [Bacillota bacterium]
MKGLAKGILAPVLVMALVLVLIPMPALAGGSVLKNENGLEIHLPERTVEMGNLNPGDVKHSHLTLVNKGPNTLLVSIRTNIIAGGEESPQGGSLTDIMNLTIGEGHTIVASGTFGEVIGEGNILLKPMTPGEERILYFTGSMPQDAGNDYQGSSFRASWTFTSQVSASGPPGGGDEGDTDLPPVAPGGEDLTQIGEEEIPAGVGEVDDEGLISIDEEELPTGASIMPQTGEASHSIFSGLGLALIAGGLALFKRRT